MEIKDKVILVTGASFGIGEATARLLASKGAKVALAARSEDKLRELARDLPSSFPIVVDMTNVLSINKMIAEVKRHYGRIDILVNNAGRGTSWTPVENIDLDEYRDLMELNVYGPIIAMQQVIPIMREQGGGAIVNIGSGTVKMVRPGASIYPGTKILLQHISRVARQELEKDHIVVSIVHPFITKTNFFSTMERSGNGGSVSPALLATGDEPETVAQKIEEAITTGVEEIDMSSNRVPAT
jgi:NADP-dependent 3-hydroxy acid dehydrogenase YdfG